MTGGTKGGWRPAAGGWRTGTGAAAVSLGVLFGSCAAPRISPGPEGGLFGSLLLVDLVESRGAREDGRYLIQMLEHPLGPVRTRAARAAGRWGRPATNPEDGLPAELSSALIRLARSDPDAAARAEAIFALGQLADPDSSAALAALTLDPSPPLRAEAVLALGKVPGTPAGLILPSLLDPAPGPRGSAALALARLEGGFSSGDRLQLAALLNSLMEVEADPGVQWKLYYLLSQRMELLAERALRARAFGALGDPNFLAAAFAASALGAGGVLSQSEGGAALLEVSGLSRLLADRTRFWIARAAAARALALRAGRVRSAGREESSPPGTPSPTGGEPLGAAPVGEPEPAQLAGLASGELFAGEAGPLRRVVAELQAAGEPPPFPEVLILPWTASPSAGRRFLPAASGTRRNPRAIVSIAGRGPVRLEVIFDQAPRAAAAFLDAALEKRFEGSSFRAGKPADLLAALRSRATPRAGSSAASETGRVPFSRGSLGVVGLEDGADEGRLFVTFLPVPVLDGRFPLIARVIGGMETIDRIEEGDRIESVAIIGAPEEDPDWKRPAR